MFDDRDRIFKGWVLWLPAPEAEAMQVQSDSHARAAEAEFQPAATVPSTPLAAEPVNPTSSAVTSIPPAASDNADPPGGLTKVTDRERSATTRRDQNDASSDDRIRLPSGSEVGVGFAIGVASSVILGRINRRRRYRPGPPRPGVAMDESLPEPLPTLLGAAARSRDAAVQAEELPSAEPEMAARTCPLPEGVRRLAEADVDVARAIVVRRIIDDASDLRLIVDAATANRLFGESDGIPCVGVVETPRDALDEAEIEKVRRRRILGDAADLVEYLESGGDEFLEQTLVVGSATAVDIDRWTALADGGPALGIEVLLLGETDTDASAVVDTGIRMPDAELDRLHRDDAVAILAEFSAAHREPSPVESRPADVPFMFEEMEQVAAAELSAVEVRVIGPVGIATYGRTVFGGIRNAGKELLAYLILHPGGQPRDVIIDALWPELDFDRAKNAFSNALRSLRADVRAVLGQNDPPIVESAVVESKHAAGSVYRLQSGLFDADLWRFQTTLRDADEAPTVADRATRLRAALAAYGGEFVEGSGSLWVIGEREDLRRRALDVAVAIAELEEEAGNLEEALGAVERAIQLDVYAEDLYVRGVRLLAGLGRIESARELAGSLLKQLAEFRRAPMAATGEAIGRAISEAERQRAARKALDHRHRLGTSLIAEVGTDGRA